MYEDLHVYLYYFTVLKKNKKAYSVWYYVEQTDYKSMCSAKFELDYVYTVH